MSDRLRFVFYLIAKHLNTGILCIESVVCTEISRIELFPKNLPRFAKCSAVLFANDSSFYNLEFLSERPNCQQSQRERDYCYYTRPRTQSSEPDYTLVSVSLLTFSIVSFTVYIYIYRGVDSLFSDFFFSQFLISWYFLSLMRTKSRNLNIVRRR